MFNSKPLYYDNEDERIKHQKSLIETKKSDISLFEEDEDIMVINDDLFPSFDELDEGYPV